MLSIRGVEFMTVHEFATHHGVSYQTVMRQWIPSGLPAIKGSGWLIPVARATRWVKANCRASYRYMGVS